MDIFILKDIKVQQVNDLIYKDDKMNKMNEKSKNNQIISR